MRRRKVAVLFAVVVLVAGVGAVRLILQSAGSAMTSSAQSFLAALSDDQRSEATMAFDDPARLDWHYIPKDDRKGLQIKDMNPEQRKEALNLLRSGLSEVGYEKATTIMSLEAILRELERERGSGPIRDPERYYFTVFGAPDDSGKWGWSVEGHHLSLNFVLDDGKVVSITPAFLGSNPGEVLKDYGAGPKKGTRPLVREESTGFELLHMLTPEQRKLCVIAEKAPDDLTGGGEAQARKQKPVGLPAEQMTPEQVDKLWDLLEAYIGNMRADLAEARRQEIKDAGIENVYFAWAGADKPGIGHFYRVQGPTFVVELVNVQPDAAGNPANHIHSLWRSLKGDFGLKPAE